MSSFAIRALTEQVRDFFHVVRKKTAYIALLEKQNQLLKDLVRQCVDNQPEEWWGKDSIELRQIIWALDSQIETARTEGEKTCKKQSPFQT